MIKNYKRLDNLTTADELQFDYDSRYKTYQRIINLDNNKTCFESPNQFSHMKDLTGVYHVVEPIEEGRLDMISQIYYNDPQYFWIIAMANNIIDPLLVVQGTILKIPEFNNVYYDGGPLENKI